MKLLIDYKEDELVKLTDDEKNTLFLLECAERGVPLPETLPKYLESPEERDDLKEDEVVYSISGGRYSSDKFYFKSMEDAEEVATLLRQKTISLSSDYKAGKSVYYLGEGEPSTVEIENMRVYSGDKYTQVKEEITVYENNKKNIKSNNDRRNEIMAKQSAVMSEIDDAIYTAEKNITRVAELKGIFEKYKKMADGNQEIAVRFMLNAHYSEISGYDSEILPKIGFTQTEVDAYNAASEKAIEA